MVVLSPVVSLALDHRNGFDASGICCSILVFRIKAEGVVLLVEPAIVTGGNEF
jgi:hypothetical protein